MFGLESLDILIGLVTIYLTIALACTAIVEALAAASDLRSNNLKAALNELLAGDLKNDKPFVDAFYSHPLVLALSKGDKNRLPAYIPPQVVGQVVQALITANNTAQSITQAIMNLPGTEENNRVKGLLMTLTTQTKEDAEAFRKAVETHFDAVMDRASGWVKRQQQRVAVGVAVIFVFVANVDTFELVNKLSTNPEVRAQLITLAEQRLEQQQTLLATKNSGKIDESTAGSRDDGEESQNNKALEEVNRQTQDTIRLIDELKSSGLIFGWSKPVKDLVANQGKDQKIKDYLDLFAAGLMKLLGLLISILAISLGAPFWFDVLQRFMQVRQTGISPREKGKKKGEKESQASQAS